MVEELDSGPRDRSLIASKAAKARWAKRDQVRASRPIPPPGTPAPVPEPSAPTPAVSGYRSIADYDRQVGAPQDWAQVLQREKVLGELTLNDSRKVDLERARLTLEKERGKLVPLDEVEAREERADEIFQRHLAGVLDLVAEMVPPDQIAAAREKAGQWLAKQQRSIADEL